jgi:hypothetical protein
VCSQIKRKTPDLAIEKETNQIRLKMKNSNKVMLVIIAIGLIWSLASLWLRGYIIMNEKSGKTEDTTFEYYSGAVYLDSGLYLQKEVVLIMSAFADTSLKLIKTDSLTARREWGIVTVKRNKFDSIYNIQSY